MVKAVVLGAAGGIGQPLALLLKANPLVTELGLFDIVNTPGVAADLSHISTPAKVEGYLPPDDGLKKALAGAEIVVIPAGVPRKPGMTRDDLFKINAGIVKDLAVGIATTAPKAFVLVISNPVNSTVPIVAEVFKKHGVYDPKRIFGVTTLDVVRASTFVAEINGDLGLSKDVVVPVVGGHSGVTIVPLLSQSSHPLPTSLSKEAYDALINRIQFGGDEVVKAKGGAGSATLSMAYAGAEFAAKILRAAKGEKGIVAPSYVSVEADATGGAALTKELGQELAFFSSNVELGSEGVSKIIPLGKITEVEQGLVKAAIPELVTNIEKGVNFVAEFYKTEHQYFPPFTCSLMVLVDLSQVHKSTSPQVHKLSSTIVRCIASISPRINEEMRKNNYGYRNTKEKKEVDNLQPCLAFRNTPNSSLRGQYRGVHTRSANTKLGEFVYGVFRHHWGQEMRGSGVVYTNMAAECGKSLTRVIGKGII